MTDKTAAVTMTDGKEVDFGRKEVVLKVDVAEDGSLSLQAAFNDGQYRTLDVDIWKNGALNSAITAYAAVGLAATVKRMISGGASADFDAVSKLLVDGPLTSKPRAKKLSLTPLQRALVELTHKTPEDVVAWTDSKTRSERLALSRDSRVAAILETYKKAKPDAEPAPDLLAELAGDTDEAGDEAA